MVLTAYLVNWFSFVRQPLLEALEALKSDAQITVTNSSWLSFSPTITKPQTGLIIYPGDRIDPRGFSPSARAIAEEGYLVIVPKMTLNGDHHQFGFYELEVENLATISRAEQQKQILAATLAVLDKVNK